MLYIGSSGFLETKMPLRCLVLAASTATQVWLCVAFNLGGSAWYLVLVPERSGKQVRERASGFE